jgi:hypothetical protein
LKRAEAVQNFNEDINQCLPHVYHLWWSWIGNQLLVKMDQAPWQWLKERLARLTPHLKLRVNVALLNL